MIVAKRKPFDEIKQLLKGYKKVLNVGCGTCVAVCLAGGEKEVSVLNAELDMARKIDDNPIEISGITIERQCDREYLEALDMINMSPVSYNSKEFDNFLRISWKKINKHLIASGLIKEAATLPE